MSRIYGALAVAALALAVSPAFAQIKIASVGPMTGQNAAFGEQLRKGAEMAVADINAAGGVLGKKMELVVGDDACDPKQAVSVANDLASKGVVFVAGHYCSSSSIPASDVYAESNIVQISPGSTNVKLTDRGLANVFRVCGRDDAQGPIAAEYVAKNFAGKVIAVVDDKSQYGQGLADEFKKTLAAKGVTPAVSESITAGEKDYTALVSRLKQAKADILYFGGYKTEAGLITRQMHEQGLKTIMVGGDTGVYARAESLLAHYARAVTLMGGPGSGQLTKMVNQICIAGLVQALSEGINFAAKAGLDVERVLDVISKGAAQSWQMENRGKTMAADKFDFGFAVDWMRKDLGICIDEARHNGAMLAITKAIDGYYAEIVDMGGARWDTSSLIRRLSPSD